MPIDVLTLSTKGQLVLPSDLRKSLSLNPGDKVVAYWSNGSVVLKKLELPNANDFEKVIEKTVSIAKETGMTKQDITDTIKEYRTERKKEMKIVIDTNVVISAVFFKGKPLELIKKAINHSDSIEAMHQWISF